MLKMEQKIITKAFNEALSCHDSHDIPIGCVIFNTQTKEILTSAHNQVEKTSLVTAHAEILAINQACRLLKTPNLSGYSIYSTLEPCPMCAGAIAWAQLDRVYFGAYDPKSGGIEHGVCLFKHTHHKPEVIGGVEEEKSSLIIKNFFKEVRNGK